MFFGINSFIVKCMSKQNGDDGQLEKMLIVGECLMEYLPRYCALVEKERHLVHPFTYLLEKLHTKMNERMAYDGTPDEEWVLHATGMLEAIVRSEVTGVAMQAGPELETVLMRATDSRYSITKRSVGTEQHAGEVVLTHEVTDLFLGLFFQCGVRTDLEGLTIANSLERLSAVLVHYPHRFLVDMLEEISRKFDAVLPAKLDDEQVTQLVRRLLRTNASSRDSTLGEVRQQLRNALTTRQIAFIEAFLPEGAPGRAIVCHALQGAGTLPANTVLNKKNLEAVTVAMKQLLPDEATVAPPEDLYEATLSFVKLMPDPHTLELTLRQCDVFTRMEAYYRTHPKDEDRFVAFALTLFRASCIPVELWDVALRNQYAVFKTFLYRNSHCMELLGVMCPARLLSHAHHTVCGDVQTLRSPGEGYDTDDLRLSMLYVDSSGEVPYRTGVFASDEIPSGATVTLYPNMIMPAAFVAKAQARGVGSFVHTFTETPGEWWSLPHGMLCGVRTMMEQHRLGYFCVQSNNANASVTKISDHPRRYAVTAARRIHQDEEIVLGSHITGH